MNIFHIVSELWPGHGLLYGIKSRGIIQKPKMRELSSLFMTHRLIVMYAPVKFHEYIPYSFGVMARTRKWDVRTDGRTYGTDRGNT